MIAFLLAAALHYDVLISAGHEGRPASCPHFPQHKCNLGAAGRARLDAGRRRRGDEDSAGARRYGRSSPG